MTKPRDSQLSLKCPHCFNHLTASASLVGTKRRCPMCNFVFPVPSAEELARRQSKVDPYPIRQGMDDSPADARSYIGLRCSLCGTHLQAPEDQLGGQIQCPDCHTLVPVVRPAAPPHAVAKAAPVAGEDYAFVGEGGSRPAGPLPMEQTFFPFNCPVCGSLMQATADLVGQTLTCNDCRESVIVPPATKRPPAIRPVAPSEDTGYVMSENPDQPAEAGRPTYVPVVCPVCATRLHAALDQVGQKMVCPDCSTTITVPPPPKPRRKYGPRHVATDNYDLGETAHSSECHAYIRGRLWTAPLAEDEAENGGLRPVPPRWPFLSGVFTIPIHRKAWICWIVLSVLLSMATGLGNVALQSSRTANPMSWYDAALFLGPAAVLAMLWFLPASACMRAILIDTAQGCDRVESWPSANVSEWLGESFFAINSVCLSLMPVMLSAQVFGAAAVRLEYSLPASVAVLFPILLLSMLEADSAMMPFSVAVWRSMATSWRAWAVFYLESAALVALAVFLWPLLAVQSAVGMVSANILVVAILMIYFRLLGRLAWCCMKTTREAPQPSPEPPAPDPDPDRDSDHDPDPAPGEYVDYA